MCVAVNHKNTTEPIGLGFFTSFQYGVPNSDVTKQFPELFYPFNSLHKDGGKSDKQSDDFSESSFNFENGLVHTRHSLSPGNYIQK